MKRFAIVVLLLSSACAREASSALPADFAALVPADAVLLVQLRSGQELADEVEALRRIVAPDAPRHSTDEVFDTTLSMLRSHQALRGWDINRAVGLAVSPGASVMEPVLTYIVPSQDPDSLAAQFAEPRGEGSTATSGSYVAVRFGPGSARPDGVSPLLTDFPPGLIGVRCELGSIIAAYRPFIDLGLMQFESMMAAAAPTGASPLTDPAAAFGMYLEGIRALLDSAERLDLALDLRDGNLISHLALRSREGSPMAGLGRAERMNYENLVARLDPTAAIQFLGCYDQAGFIQKSWGVYESMLQGLQDSGDLPPELVTAFGSYLRGLQEILPLFGREVAGSFDFTTGGMRMATDVQAADPDGLADRMTALLRGDDLAALGFEVGPVTQGELAGCRAIFWNQKMDFTRMSRFWQSDIGAAPMDDKQLQDLSARLLGKDGLEIVLLPGSGRMGMVAGGDSSWRETAALRLTKGGAADPDLLRAIEPLQGANPGLLVRMNLTPFVGVLIGDLEATGMDAEQAASLKRAAQSLGDQPVRIVLYGGMTGRTMVAGCSSDAAGIARWFAAALVAQD